MSEAYNASAKLVPVPVYSNRTGLHSKASVSLQ